LKYKESILVLGDHSALMSTLAERIPLLGFQCARAKTPAEAIDLANERNFRFGVCLIDASIPAVDIAQALDALRTQTASPRMTYLASGEIPSEEAREQLREAGVRQAVWSPVSDNVLRYQLNAALSRDEDEILRCEPRAPVEFSGIVSVAGRSKRVSVYSLSGGGAYLVTQRPSMPGAEIRLDIPGGEGPMALGARVLYTNVPGNLSMPHLPHGMAVKFLEAKPTDADALRQRVAATLGSLTV
jgi:CheY-like chemotaxis protein